MNFQGQDRNGQVHIVLEDPGGLRSTGSRSVVMDSQVLASRSTRDYKIWRWREKALVGVMILILSASFVVMTVKVLVSLNLKQFHRCVSQDTHPYRVNDLVKRAIHPDLIVSTDKQGSWVTQPQTHPEWHCRRDRIPLLLASPPSQCRLGPV